MSEVRQFVCDNPKCGAVKKSENHWWVVRVGFDHATVFPLDPSTGITLPDHFIFCGEACVLKKISEWMGAKR